MKQLSRHVLIFYCFLLPFQTALAFEWSNQGLRPDCPRSGNIPNLRLEAITEFHLDHALIMLWASWLAERPRRSMIKNELKVRGFKKIELFGPAFFGSNAFLAETDKFRLLVFRGSQDVREWTRNAMFQQSDASALGLPGKIHQGMMRHFEELSPSILSSMQRSTKPLIISGHSLGGAMALLHSLVLEEMGHEIKAIYVSGAPRVGDADFYNFAEILLSQRFYSIEMERDLVPMIPPSQSMAPTIAGILPEHSWFLRSKLENLVHDLGYAVANWQTIRINQFAPSLKRYGIQGEKDYWLSLQSQLVDVDSLAAFWQSMGSRFEGHAPEVYFCELLDRR